MLTAISTQKRLKISNAPNEYKRLHGSLLARLMSQRPVLLLIDMGVGTVQQTNYYVTTIQQLFIKQTSRNATSCIRDVYDSKKYQSVKTLFTNSY